MKGHPNKYTLALIGLFVAGNLVSAEKAHFNRDIRPILSDRCFQCHGPHAEDRKGDLRLDIPDGSEGALTQREDYFVIKPGDPDESELIWRISDDFEEDRMPPLEAHKPALSEEEIAVFKQWILEGAEYQDYWAYIPPEISEPAEVKDESWTHNTVDHYVMASLEKEGLQPKAEADKRTLIRRVTFDLTGLPPAVDEIQDFIKDTRPDSYAKLVDRLLADNSYGEHMTRYWADLVRLGDTNGMHKDFHREFSPLRDWIIRSFNDNLPFDEFIKYQLAGDLFENPSREQLIASGFNRLHMIIDKGTAQPAESLHKNVSDRVEAFGTAFLGLTVQCAQCHDHKYDPITQRDYYQLYAFFNNFVGAPETVRAPERGLQPPFINLTTPSEDGVLATFDAEQHALDIEREAAQRIQNLEDDYPKVFDKVQASWIWDEDVSDVADTEFKTSLALSSLPDSVLARFAGKSNTEVWINGTSLGTAYSEDQSLVVDVRNLLRFGKNEIIAVSTRAEAEEKESVYIRPLTPAQLARRELAKVGFSFILEYDQGESVAVFSSDSDWLVRKNESAPWRPAVEITGPDHTSAWMTKVRTNTIIQFVKRQEDLENRKRKFLKDIPAAMIMAEMNHPRETRMLIGGDYENPGNRVERNTPAFLPSLPDKEGSYTRMDLAEWLVTLDHPLTARIAVNRFWQNLFGVGLVKTSEDFGLQGEWPSHPELLDYLAIRFRDSGWDVKQLIREIVLSKTYKQISDATLEEFKADPDNRKLARGSRYRMDAEMIRDQILAVSGQLNLSMYGKSVKPPQPPGLWRMVSMAHPFSFVADEGEKIYRRSLYTYWRRGMPPPQMTLMNAPSREFCVARRERTNTPLQALLLMNEEEYFKAAKVTSMNALEETNGADAGLKHIYEIITSHLPGADRLNLMKETLADFKKYYEGKPELAKSMTSGMKDSSISERVEVAAWTMVTHGLLNLELAKVRR